MSTLESGQKVGRYKIVRFLGAGAMGEVYLAEDPHIERRLAIKTVRLAGGRPQDIEDRKKRLLREARAAGRLLHPNVVALFDAGEEDSLLYLAFEFVEGCDLASRLETGPPPTLREVLHVVRQVADALDYAHRQGIVHRDIKPSNILIDTAGRVKVADFGIAKMAGQNTELTVAGSVMGSPQYLSPEQIRGDELDGRSDIFSLGVVLYELLSGRRPFDGETITTLVYQILHKDPSISELRAVPVRIEQLLHAMLAKDREQRIATASVVAEDLAAIEHELPAATLDAAAAPADDVLDQTRVLPSRSVSALAYADATPAGVPAGTPAGGLPPGTPAAGMPVAPPPSPPTAAPVRPASGASPATPLVPSSGVGLGASAEVPTAAGSFAPPGGPGGPGGPGTPPPYGAGPSAMPPPPPPPPVPGAALAGSFGGAAAAGSSGSGSMAQTRVPPAGSPLPPGAGTPYGSPPHYSVPAPPPPSAAAAQRGSSNAKLWMALLGVVVVLIAGIAASGYWLWQRYLRHGGDETVATASGPSGSATPAGATGAPGASGGSAATGSSPAGGGPASPSAASGGSSAGAVAPSPGAVLGSSASRASGSSRPAGGGAPAGSGASQPYGGSGGATPPADAEPPPYDPNAPARSPAPRNGGAGAAPSRSGGANPSYPTPPTGSGSTVRPHPPTPSTPSTPPAPSYGARTPATGGNAGAGGASTPPEPSSSVPAGGGGGDSGAAAAPAATAESADRVIKSGLELAFRVNPADAYVLLDGGVIGQASEWTGEKGGRPFVLPGTGPHLIKIKKPGMKDYRITVEASATRGVTPVVVALQPLPAAQVDTSDLQTYRVREAIALRLQPEVDAVVQVDGTSVGAARRYAGRFGHSDEWLSLPMGTHRVTVIAPGYVRRDLAIEITGGAEKERQRIDVLMRREARN